MMIENTSGFRQDQSSTDATLAATDNIGTSGTNQAPTLPTLRGITDGYAWVAREKGISGITVTAPITHQDREPEQFTLPPIAGRIDTGTDFLHIIPGAEDSRVRYGDTKSIRDLSAFHKAGWGFLAEKMEGKSRQAVTLRNIWREVARSWRAVGKSPAINEGIPPLAPVLTTMRGDESAAREAWSEIGSALTPLGRLIVGASLMAPWMELHGAHPTVLSIVGAAGTGKSTIAHVCAGLYSDYRLNNGLFRTFSSSALGIPTRAKTLSYLPLILDESNDTTGDIEKTLTNLVMGATRERASRDGTVVEDNAKWHSLCVVTGNNPIRPKHEMFARRFLDVDSRMLWNVPGNITSAERDIWWSDIYSRLDFAAGWMWSWLMRDYPAGTEIVYSIRDFAARNTGDFPGGDSLGRLMQLGITGCVFMSGYTENKTWTAGVSTAARDLLVSQQDAVFSPSRDAAEKITASITKTPGAWNGDSFSREVLGWESNGLDSEKCHVLHDDSCKWYDVPGSEVKTLTGYEVQRLTVTEFKNATYSGGANKKTTRAVRRNGEHKRVLTFCVNALEELAHPGDEWEQDREQGSQQDQGQNVVQLPLPALPKYPQVPTPHQGGRNAQKGTQPREQEHEQKQEQASVVTLERETYARRRVWGATDSTEFDAALDEAARDGVTDLVGPATWTPQQLRRWDPGTWQGTGDASATVRLGEHEIRAWRASRGMTPEQYKDELEGFIQGTGQGEFFSPANLAQRLVLGHRGNHTPRWLLPDDMHEAWSDGATLHPRQWGEHGAKNVTQYDRNRSYLGAITQANLAPLWFNEKFEHYGNDAPVSKEVAGMYRIAVPEWNHVLPSPAAHAEPGSIVWTTAEIMRLFHELKTYPAVHEAWLAPVHKIAHLEAFKVQIEAWYEQFNGKPGTAIVKSAYQALAGSMVSEHNAGKRRHIYRPDWGNAIADNSWANVLRRAYKVWEADNNFVPVRINMDAIYYPEGLAIPPELPIGKGLGQFKIEGGAK